MCCPQHTCAHVHCARSACTRESVRELLYLECLLCLRASVRSSNGASQLKPACLLAGCSPLMTTRAGCVCHMMCLHPTSAPRHLSEHGRPLPAGMLPTSPTPSPSTFAPQPIVPPRSEALSRHLSSVNTIAPVPRCSILIPPTLTPGRQTCIGVEAKVNNSSMDYTNS